MRATSTLESLLRRDRLVVIAALVAVIVACWAYVLAGAGMDMSPLETTAMTGAPGMAETGDAPPGVDMPGMDRSDMPEMDMPGMDQGDMPGMATWAEGARRGACRTWRSRRWRRSPGRPATPS